MMQNILKRIKKTDWYKKDFLKNRKNIGTNDDTLILRWMWRWVKDIFLIVLGIFTAAFGLESFLLPNEFIDGGATGIALLVAGTTKVPLGLGILLVNTPFVILGYTILGRRFAIKIAFAILGLALVISTISFPVLTNDKLLVAVFGGFFLGAGIGLSIRGGAVLDGTEVLAIYLSKRFNTTIGDVIIAINVVIFCTAAYFLSIETALYSMITYLAASKTLDFIIVGIEEYIGVTIISGHNEEIRQKITEELGRGVTVYKGRRGFGKKGHTDEMDILYCVITRLEISRLNEEIDKIDSDAFVIMSSIKDTKGGMVKRRPLH
jgi:uncharacterized membrane-anchored protein YitT (DUF2179 family)